MRKRFRITVDTAKESAINMHIGEGKVIKFMEVEYRLYKECFTKRELVNIELARDLHQKLDAPGYKNTSKY